LGSALVAGAAPSSLGASSAFDVGRMGIRWIDVPGVEDPVMTTDRGALPGQCDISACSFLNPEAGHYAFVDNCLDGGAGCVEHLKQSGCRFCTVYADGGLAPLWLPSCPPCVCEVFDIQDPNSTCADIIAGEDRSSSQAFAGDRW